MKKYFLYLIVFLLALSACGAQPTGVPDHKILVTVSIPPQAWVVEQIGGDLVSVQAMAGPSDDPHTYEPKPAQMAALAGTELYLIHAPEHPMKAVRDGLAQVVAVGGYTFTVLAADLAEATR